MKAAVGGHHPSTLIILQPGPELSKVGRHCMTTVRTARNRLESYQKPVGNSERLRNRSEIIEAIQSSPDNDQNIYKSYQKTIIASGRIVAPPPSRVKQILLPVFQRMTLLARTLPASCPALQ